MATERTPDPKKGVQGNPGQVPWQEDPDILARMQEGARLRAQGLTGAEIALRQGIGRTQVYEDRKNLLELRKEQALAASDEHIENLRQRIAELDRIGQQVKQMLDDTDQRSLNRGALAAQLRQIEKDKASIEMDIAKLDGSLVEKRETKLEADGVTFTLNLKPE